MPTVLSGQRDTLNIETTRKKLDAEPKIALFDPQITPLVTSLFTYGRQFLKDEAGRVKVGGLPILKRVATNPRVDWWEDELLGFKSTINLAAGYAAGDTSIVVADGTLYQTKDVIFNPRTGELLEVSAVSTNTLTVRRGVGNSGVGVAINDKDEIVIIGSAYPEGAASNSGRSTKEVNNFNYLQIQRTPVEETRTFSKTELYTEDDWAFELKKQGIEHVKKLERMMFFGKREESTDTSNNAAGKPKRYSGGIIGQFISTNVFSFNGTLTESDFHIFLETALRNGSPTKYLFCAPRVLSVISNWAHGRLKTRVDDKIFGVTIHEYQSPHGMVSLIRQPMFDEISAYNGAVVALDLADVKYRFLKDSDVSLLPNRQANDIDGRKAEYLSESGIQLQIERDQALATGISN